MNALGRHLLVEYYQCDTTILNDVTTLEEAMNDAARHAHATILQSVFHAFSPHGVSGVIVIAESHLTIHTWPEHRYAAVDIFTCGNTADPMRACHFLLEALQAKTHEVQEHPRGTKVAAHLSLNPPSQPA